MIDEEILKKLIDENGNLRKPSIIKRLGSAFCGLLISGMGYVCCKADGDLIFRLGGLAFLLIGLYVMIAGLLGKTRSMTKEELRVYHNYMMNHNTDYKESVYRWGKILNAEGKVAKSYKNEHNNVTITYKEDD